MNSRLPQQRSTISQWTALAAILVLAGVVRFHDLGSSSLWMDEIWSIEIAAGHGPMHNQLTPGIVHIENVELANLRNAPPWWTVWSYRSDFTWPPLYPLLLRFWMDIFGTGAIAIRSLSAIFSLLAVWLLFDICRLLHGWRPALLAAILMAVATAQREFAQEARGYTMGLCLALVSCDAIVRIGRLGANKLRLWILAISLTAGMLTNYLLAGVDTALLAYAIWSLAGKDRRRTILAFIAAGAAWIALWGWPFVEQIHNLPPQRPDFMYESASASASHLSITIRRFLGLPGMTLIDAFPENPTAATAYALIALFLLLAFIVYLAPLIRRRPASHLHTTSHGPTASRHIAAPWSFWLAGTAGLLAVIDLSRGTILLSYLRYGILASPAVYAIIASLNWPKRPRDAAAIFAIVIAAIFAVQRWTDGPPDKENWRSLARQIDQSTGPDDLLVFYGDNPWLSPGTWYMGYRYYATDSHRPWLILNNPATPDLLEQLRGRPSIWLIGPFPQQEGPTLLPGWQSTGKLIQTTAGAACEMIPNP